MASCFGEKPFDIQKDLIHLTPHLYQNLGIPYTIFESDPKSRARSKFSIPCAENEDLYFSIYYGDSWISKPIKSSRRLIIKRKTRRKSPEDISVEAIRDNIAECIDSVEEADKEFASLKLIIGNVYFEGEGDMTIEDQNAFFEGNVHADQFYVNFRNTTMFFCHQICEWESPVKALHILEKVGFSRTSPESETLDPDVSLVLRGGFLRKRVGESKYLFFDNTLKLDATTLAVKSWRVQDWFPMSYFLMHGFPYSNDVIIRTNIERHVEFDHLFALCSRPHRNLPGLMANNDDSGSFIQRTKVGFKLLNRYDNMKCIIEKGSGERIRLQHNSVSCFMNLAPMKYYHFNSISNEFTLTNDQSCEAVIEFSLTGDREELIDVIARLSLEFFSKSNDEDKLPLITPPSYLNQSDGTRISVADTQAIKRLYLESGDLCHLLGLGENWERKDCQRKAIALKTLLLKCRDHEWFQSIDLNFDELMRKLTCACLAYGINL